jgi:phosphoribosylformylglycinamidine (FGAM) synthase-like amidotransferase family enzyme
MMPHPERAVSAELGGSDGATLLRGCLEALAS